MLFSLIFILLSALETTKSCPNSKNYIIRQSGYKTYMIYKFFKVLNRFSSKFQHIFGTNFNQIDSKVPYCDLKMSSTDDTLIFANVVFRHGDRNIVRAYPNDPYKDEKHWKEGFSQLTKQGMLRQYKLGQYFRRRYNHILGEYYSKDNVYVQSSDYNRTVMSAQANLAGLFPPSEDEKFCDEILWQPIPVHTLPRKQDNVIAIENDDNFKDLVAKSHAESKEVQRIFKEYSDEIAYWSKMSGAPLKATSHVYWLFNTLEIEKNQGKKIPEWAEEVIKPGGIMEYISGFDFTLYAATPLMAQIASGSLLKEICEHFIHKVNGTLKPDRTLWLYSGHDYSIANALNSLGMFNEIHIPPYAASLHFELYKRSDNSHYVQMFYRKSEEEYPSPMNIPGHGEKCSVKDFVELCKKVFPSDLDSKCRL